MSARRAVVRTDPAGVDGTGRRWFLLLVYPDSESMRRAACRYRGVPAAEYENAGATVQGDHVDPGNGFAGVIRLSTDFCTGEVIAHEAVHAAGILWRGHVSDTLFWGDHVSDLEEQFAYLVGEIAAAVTNALYRLGVWSRAALETVE